MHSDFFTQIDIYYVVDLILFSDPNIQWTGENSDGPWKK